jgi:toxin ParE1/3/4
MKAVRFSLAARSDIAAILTHTYENFGHDAQLRYEYLLATAFRDLSEEPARIGSVSREEFGAGVRSFHLRHSRDRSRHETGIVHQPRHFILYRNVQPSVIGIGRVLHDAMDAQRHLPSLYGDDIL